MKKIYEVSEEEKNRIRGLHLVESDNKKIDSTILSEAPATDRCGGNYPCHGPSGRRVSWQACPGYSGPNLLNPLPCAMIDGQTPNSSHVGKYVGLQNIGWCGKVTSIGPHTLPGTTTSCPPTGLVLGTDCDNCYTRGNGGDITYNCNNGNCIGINGNSGQFATLSDCEDDCADPIKYSCNNGACVQDPNGQYTTLSDCEDNCDPLPSITYDCGIQGSCVPVQGAGGQYMTMADCTEECKYEGNWRCKNYDQEPQLDVMQPIEDVKSPRELYEQIPTSGYHCIKSLNGPFTSQQQCQAQCPGDGGKTIDCINCEQGVMTQVQGSYRDCPPGFSPVTSLTQGPCTECQPQAGCINVGWGYGANHFNSMTECQQSNCQPPTQYECVNNSCVPDPNGQFANIGTCQASGCGQAGGNTYDCTGSAPFGPPSACVPVSGPGGQFATLDDCLVSPCACDDVITVWPLYTNNPNIGTGSGTWYGTGAAGHDGPSNLNAVQNQLNNLLGNPNFPGGNPVQQHKTKCREAAMNFWLGGPGNIACCVDPGFAAGAATGDQYGCVSTASFIPMMNNFMNNHAGWPAQGCTWLQGVLASAQTQLATGSNGGPFPPSSNAYCKITGKIDFITNFIATAQSQYLTGTAVFTPGC